MVCSPCTRRNTKSNTKPNLKRTGGWANRTVVKPRRKPFPPIPQQQQQQLSKQTMDQPTKRRQRRKITVKMIKIMGARQQWKCIECRNLLSDNFEVDHRVPLFDDGPDCLENMDAICQECHALKTQEENLTRETAELLTKTRTLLTKYLARHENMLDTIQKRLARRGLKGLKGIAV